jgi:hypothetical protein
MVIWIFVFDTWLSRLRARYNTLVLLVSLSTQKQSGRSSLSMHACMRKLHTEAE